MKIALPVILLAVILGSSVEAQEQNRTGSFAPRDNVSHNTVSKSAREHARRLHREGVRYGRAKLFRQAAASFKKAIELDPFYADAYHGLGQAYFDLRRWREAIEAWEQVIQLDPDDQTYRKLSDARSMQRADQKREEKSAKSKATPVTETVVPHRKATFSPAGTDPKMAGRGGGPLELSSKPETAGAEPRIASGQSNLTSVQNDKSKQLGQSGANRPGFITPRKSPRLPTILTRSRPGPMPEELVLSASFNSSAIRVGMEQPPAFPILVRGNGLFRVNTEARAEAVSDNSSGAKGSLPVLRISFPQANAVDRNLMMEPAFLPSLEEETLNRSGDSELLAMAAPPPLEPLPATEEQKPVDLTRLYQVGVGDILDVRLRDAPFSDSTLFTVTATGFLEHPMLSHPLRVVGLTTDEISQRVATDLKNRAISENPEVLVGVREYVSHTIIVSGLVKDPGTKVLRREAIPLYVVLADAQPLPEAGRVVIVSNDTREPRVINLDNAPAADHLVRPGDVVTVQPSPKEFIYIGGEVKLPGEKFYREGLTLTQAILAAGGLNNKGKEVQIARENELGLLTVSRYKLKDINAGKVADPAVRSGDRITVTN